MNHNFQKINNISGWAVFVAALATYWVTMEPTASYWDCGEFISVAYKLEVSHPPGAPFFMLIGRLFSFLAFGDVS
ncbi:MAG: protein O-mannosyl-transferase family, partial [Bacteroidota bacterium]